MTKVYIATEAALDALDTRLATIETAAVGSSNVESFVAITASHELAIEAAIVAATAANTRAGVVEFGQGRVYTLTTRPVRLAPALIGLELRFNGATVKSSAAAKGRAFDLWRAADYDAFQNITLSGPGTVDGASVAQAPNQHLLLGNLIDGAWSQRINAQNITVRQIKVINAATNLTAFSAGSRHIISIGSNQLGASEPLTTLRDILVEDCDFQGGNSGVVVMGTGSSAATVLYDNIVIRNVKHDTLITPASFHGDSNFQVGGYAHGGGVTITDCEGTGSQDVGIEIDGAQHAHVENTIITDSWNAEFFATSFNAPADINGQTVCWKDCQAIVKNINPTNGAGPAYGWQLPHNASPGFGTYILEGCSYTNTNTNFDVAGHALFSSNHRCQNLVIRDFTVSMPNVNYTPGSAKSPSLLALRSIDPMHVQIDGLYLRVAGTINANVAPQWITYSGGGAGIFTSFDIQNVVVDGNLAGASNGFNNIIVLGASNGTMCGRIKGFRLRSWAGGDTLPKRIQISGTATLTLDRLHVDECDFLSTVAGFELYFPSNNQDKVSCGAGIRWGSNIGNPPTVASAAALTVPAISMVRVSGTANITSMTALPPDTLVVLLFTGTAAGTGLTAGGNLKIPANFVYTPNDAYPLICDGTNFYAVGAGSVNP